MLWHILLGKNNGKLLGAVVPEIEKYHHISLLDGPQGLFLLIHNYYGLNKFVGDSFIVRLLKALTTSVAVRPLP